MKFLTITVFDVAKTSDLVKVSDKVMKNTPGYKPLAMYACMGNPFPGEIPPNSMVTVSISEVETDEALGAVTYPLALAGATIHRVPIMEVTPGTSEEVEKKLRD